MNFQIKILGTRIYKKIKHFQWQKKEEEKVNYLAHIWRAEAATMWRFGEIMERKNPQPPFFIHIARVCVDLSEALKKPMMLKDCLYEEQIGITHHPQITPI